MEQQGGGGDAQCRKNALCSDGVRGFYGRLSSFGIENRRPSAVLSGGRLAAGQSQGAVPTLTWAVREKRYSQRRACGLVGLHQGLSPCVQAPGDERLRARLRDLASHRRRLFPTMRDDARCSGSGQRPVLRTATSQVVAGRSSGYGKTLIRQTSASNMPCTRSGRAFASAPPVRPYRSSPAGRRSPPQRRC